jgi:hypothetical protein
MKKSLLIAAAMAFFMLLTRGSHVLTQFSLPDASLALFLLAGLWLGVSIKSRLAWFAGFFALATFIDFGAAALDPAQGFCLTDGYWGLIPSYAAMWLGGVWLSRQRDAFNIVPYTLVSLGTTFIAFVISTQTYYLFSGRFPDHGLARIDATWLGVLAKLDGLRCHVFCGGLVSRNGIAQLQAVQSVQA